VDLAQAGAVQAADHHRSRVNLLFDQRLKKYNEGMNIFTTLTRPLSFMAAGLCLGLLIAPDASILLAIHFHGCKAPVLAPWRCVGACGVVSSGGATGGSIVRWIGRGVTGTLLDAELQAGSKFEMDENTPGTGAQESRLLNIKFYGHFAPWDMDIGLPLTWKIKGTGLLGGGGTQVGGMGDLNFDIMRKWGRQGSLRTAIGLTFPTGKADVYITNRNILPQSLQNGRGNYVISPDIDYTIDRDNGFLLIGTGYSAGVLYYKPTEHEYSAVNSRVDATHFRLAWARSGWASKNEVGAVFADFAGLYANLAVKQKKTVHGFGLSLAIPMADNGYTEFLYGGTVDTSVAPTRQMAQTYADTVATTTYVPTDTGPREVHSLRYENPEVWVKDYTGKWVVRDNKFHGQRMYPELTFSYSLELEAIENYPMLLALSWPIRLGAGSNAVYGFSVSAGLKIPIW
jgi:hypothetical protein